MHSLVTRYNRIYTDTTKVNITTALGGTSVNLFAMSFDIDECESVIRTAVKEAGKIVNEAIKNRSKEVEIKSCDVDLVTKTDQDVEKFLISRISSNFPSHKFMGEESTANGAKCVLDDDPTWIIDPIDGTMNFVHGFPNVAISVGLLIKKEPVLAIIYNPILEQFFEARRGRGATLNGEKITTSSEKDLSKALVMYEFGTSREPEKQKIVLENISKLFPKVRGLRAIGSAALNMAMVALGCADADFEFGIHAWDVAAGWLIVKEAGGVVIDPAGGEFDVLSRRVLCAGTEELARRLTEELSQYYPERD